MRISPLASHPGFAPILVQWLLEHWRFALPDDTFEARMTRLQAHMQDKGLPMALVAHRDGQVLGTVSLRQHELSDWPELAPWLGGLFVHPGARRQGVGEALCLAAEHQAASMGVTRLHLFTLDRRDWYARQGWQTLASCSWQGHQGSIMFKPPRACRPASPAAC